MNRFGLGPANAGRYVRLVAGALVAGVVLTGAAAAQGPRAGGPGGPGGPGRGMRGGGPGGLPFAALDLTESQQQQIRDIRERGRESARDAEQRVRQAMEAQRKAVEAIPINEGVIRATTQQLAEAQTEVAIHQARMLNEVWALLTPAQQEQAKTLQDQREARAAQRRDNVQQRRQR